jgi:hypothetical protein
MADSTNIGGVSLNEIAELMKSQSEDVDPADVDILGRFCHSIAKLLILRRNKQEKDFSAFILWKRSDRPQVDGLIAVPSVSNGNDEIGGDIWFCNHFVNHNSWKLSGKATKQEDLHEELKKLDAGPLATIIVDWRSGEPQAQVLINGINAQESLKLHLEDGPISADHLKALLDSIYENNFRNPTVVRSSEHGKIWTNPNKGWPCLKPEAVIQGQVKTALQAALSRHIVKPEVINDDGRADLIIYKKVRSELGHLARRTDWLIEFKALRDRTPDGKNYVSPTPSEALTSGITQLLGYSPHVDPNEKSLCCYDLREEDEGDDKCFACVESVAEEKEIHTWRWYCYRSTPAAREVRFGPNATSGK